MNRGLSVDQLNVLASASITSVYLIQIGINNGTDLYYTNAPFDITIGSDTFEAQGNFINIGSTNEKANIEITNVQITVSALDLSLVQQLAVSDQINQEVSIYKVFLNQTDNTVITDKVLLFQGRISSYNIQQAERTATMSINVASQFDDFEKSTGRRTNLGNIQKEFPQDYSMEYSHVTLRDIKWGSK